MRTGSTGCCGGSLLGFSARSAFLEATAHAPSAAAAPGGSSVGLDRLSDDEKEHGKGDEGLSDPVDAKTEHRPPRCVT